MITLIYTKTVSISKPNMSFDSVTQHGRIIDGCYTTGTSLYSENPHKRTGVLGVQADFVLIHQVFSAKSA